MKNYMEEIEEIHPCIEIHEKIIDDNNNQIDIVMHESEEMFFDYDFFMNGEHVDGGRLLTLEPQNVIDVCMAEVKRLNSKQYRTQEQFDEIVDSLINGNFNQAVDFVIEYGFYAKDLREFIDGEMEYNDNSYFKNEDFYQLIESATKKRQQKNKEQ
tara:strand:+ start:4733 stop:5200 length:468 start_codon:yes stop_codon:yes gene_type:complete